MNKLDELQKLCDEATLGEWYWMHNGNALLSNSTPRRPVVLLASQDGCFKTRDKQGLLKSLDDDDADAKFIAAARTYMPLLIAVVRAAESNPCRHYAEQEGCTVCDALKKLKEVR